MLNEYDIIIIGDSVKNIEEFKKYYYDNKNTYEMSEVYNKAKNGLIDFKNNYSLDNFKNLRLEDYALGTDNKESLCYKMEFGIYKYTGPGIGGSTAFKYGIYYSRDKNSYVTRDGICTNPDYTWNVIRNDIFSLVNSISNATTVEQIINEPESLKGMSMVLTKICFCYYPYKLISIAGKKQLKKVLDTFDIKYNQNYTAVQLSYLINKEIRDNIPELKDEFPFLLGNLLWDFCDVKDSKSNLKELNITRTWIYAPGNNASEWENFYSEGIMGINCDDLGDLRQYSSKSEIKEILQNRDNSTSQKNSALANWEFANVMNIGDVVYAKRGAYTIIGKGIVTSDYIFDENRNEYKSIRKVNWISREEKDHKADMGVMVRKTLTDITKYPDYVRKLNELYGQKIVESLSYNKYDFLEEVLMTEDKYDNIIATLERKKNIILQGVPGVGKTFCAKKLMYSLMEEKADSRIKTVQFHQSYSYEDFIQGFRPNDDGKFELVDGIFYQLVQDARKEYERAISQNVEPKKYCMIIDEINRGNLSKVFGELMMLIESDKRDSRWSVKLTYSDEDFYIPSNLYIIGTMNTADRSLAMIDYALRRRFAFIDLEPVFETDETCDKFRNYLTNVENVDKKLVDSIITNYKKLNEYMKENLSKDFTIGHSYFINQFNEQDNYKEIYDSIVRYEIIPLLDEYFYDNKEKVDEARKIIENI